MCCTQFFTRCGHCHCHLQENMVRSSSEIHVSFNLFISLILKNTHYIKNAFFAIKIIVDGNVLVIPTDVWVYCFHGRSDPTSYEFSSHWLPRNSNRLAYKILDDTSHLLHFLWADSVWGQKLRVTYVQNCCFKKIIAQLNIK